MTASNKDTLTSAEYKIQNKRITEIVNTLKGELYNDRIKLDVICRIGKFQTYDQNIKNIKQNIKEQNEIQNVNQSSSLSSQTNTSSSSSSSRSSQK